MRVILRYNALYAFLVVILVFTSILNRRFVILGFDYLIYGVFLLLFSLKIIFGSTFWVPRHYLVWFVLLVSLVILNSYISIYVPNTIYIICGAFFSFLPFLHFIVSYNYTFSASEINRFIDVLIKCIVIICFIVWCESLFFPIDRSVGNVLGTNVFMLGFFASLCNQGLVLSFAQYLRLKERCYIKSIVFLVVTITLTFQLKAIIGMLFVIMGYSFMRIRNKGKALAVSLCVVLLMIPIALSIPALRQKIEKYVELYDFSNADSGIARVALYYTSFKIAEDYFPLGAGQGTFGSIPVNMVRSNVYSDYYIDNVYGLSEKDKVDFKMDTHWSSILGEMGVAGIVCYLALMTFPFRRYRKKYFRSKIREDYFFIILFSPLVMMLESLFLPLPNRLAFIVIYSGLVGIIFRHEVEQLKQNKLLFINCESTSSYN